MNENLKNKLRDGAQSVGVSLSEEMLEKFGIYMDLLLEWNEKINLTAITEPHEVVSKHFVDSLSLLFCAFREDEKGIDVGTGAGFPSVPMLIANPSLQIVMLDSLAKRLKFLEEVLNRLNLTATLAHMRAEDAGKDAKYREKFDFATARAVANLATLSEYCLPFVKQHGRFLAMKGDAAEETDAAKGAISKLGGKIQSIHEISYDDWNHTIVEIKKISTTPSKYPRKAGKPAKEPLK